MENLAVILAWAQAAYFVTTGVWPLVHMPSFLAVTGPKTDLWLVRVVGVLIAVIGSTLAVSAWRRDVDPHAAWLAAASAAALATVDVYYVARGRISPIYLADAVAEVVLVAGWVAAWTGGSTSV